MTASDRDTYLLIPPSSQYGPYPRPHRPPKGRRPLRHLRRPPSAQRRDTHYLVRSILLTALSVVLSACLGIPTHVGATGKGSARLAQPLRDNDRILICSFGEKNLNLQDYVNEYCPDVKVLYRSSDEECATLLAAAEKADPFSGRMSDDLIRSVRYVFRATMNNDKSIHLPLWVPFFGVVAGRKRSSWTATVWGLPTGEYLGDIEVVSEGEVILVQYIVGVFVEPETEQSATKQLAQEICGLVKGSQGGSGLPTSK